MSIVSSAVTISPVQKDKRFWVHEVHVDNINLRWMFDYLVAVGEDVNAVLAARAITVAADLVARETTANIAQVTSVGSFAVITVNYSTQASQLPALRAAYLIATQTQAIMIGDFLSSLTNAQLQMIFNMTPVQVDTLRTTKLTPAADAATTIRTANGQ